MAAESVGLEAPKLPFLLMASEEALRYAKVADSEERDEPHLASYWEGYRDAMYAATRMLTRREFYDTEEVGPFSGIVDKETDRGQIFLPIPTPR